MKFRLKLKNTFPLFLDDLFNSAISFWDYV